MTFKTLAALVNLFKTYPAVTGGLVNIAVALVAHLGFKVTASQLVEVVSFTAALTAIVVHNSVVPLAKVSSPKVHTLEVIDQEDSK